MRGGRGEGNEFEMQIESGLILEVGGIYMEDRGWTLEIILVGLVYRFPIFFKLNRSSQIEPNRSNPISAGGFFIFF